VVRFNKFRTEEANGFQAMQLTHTYQPHKGVVLSPCTKNVCFLADESKSPQTERERFYEWSAECFSDLKGLEHVFGAHKIEIKKRTYYPLLISNSTILKDLNVTGTTKY
jgi:hypothetical protein